MFKRILSYLVLFLFFVSIFACAERANCNNDTADEFRQEHAYTQMSCTTEGNLTINFVIVNYMVSQARADYLMELIVPDDAPYVSIDIY